MTVPTAGTVPPPAAPPPDALLLVSTETGAAHVELVSRLKGVAQTHLWPPGPEARMALAAVVAAGLPRVVAVPLTLGAQDPLLADLGALLRWARVRWPETTFLQAAPFASPEHLVGWASRQAGVAQGQTRAPAPPGETALLLVAEGRTPAANAEVCAAARLLWEHRDYQRVEVAFTGGARPTVAQGLDACLRLGARQVVAVPLALTDGSFLREVRAQVAAADPQAVCAGPLLSPAGAAAVVRQRYEEALARWFRAGEDGLASDHGHDHGLADDPLRAGDALLPPRYQGGQEVSAAPMRSASLKYDAQGQVAWNEVWQSFCNLALAGGPPHRGTLLEAPLREEVCAEPEASARVAAEIARGLRLITRLPVVIDGAPGWVGLVCPQEEMAVWLLRAIVVENVSVRREGSTLFLPAGPAYRVEKEIKNVITAVAKTHHYWTEHRAALSR